MTRALIHHPENVPVVGCDSHLPAVERERLSGAALRQRFADPPAWQVEFPGDGGRFAQREPKAASVLVPLVERPEGVNVLLTRRTDHLKDHAGQISFPGGRQEEHDADVVAAALREAQEEIGLAPESVEVIGTLPVYSTVSAFQVTPVIALVQPPLMLALDAFEVAEAFEVPLPFLMDPHHHQRHRFEFDGQARQFLSMPWQGTDASGEPRRYFIWGATAAMLRNLYRFLRA